MRPASPSHTVTLVHDSRPPRPLAGLGCAAASSDAIAAWHSQSVTSGARPSTTAAPSAPPRMPRGWRTSARPSSKRNSASLRGRRHAYRELCSRSYAPPSRAERSARHLRDAFEAVVGSGRAHGSVGLTTLRASSGRRDGGWLRMTTEVGWCAACCVPRHSAAAARGAIWGRANDACANDACLVSLGLVCARWPERCWGDP